MHRPRKRFGQNFLVDATTIEQLVNAINPRKSDHIIEIGPGLGALTQPLLTRVNALEAVEIDHDLIAHLKNFTTREHSLTIHATDVLEFDFSDTTYSRRVVGNLPYNISTPLIFHLLDHVNSIIDMHFMMQKEVVERICAQSGDRHFGRLSIMVQVKCSTTSLFDITPDNFNPPPKVTSAFMRLKPHAHPLVAKQLEPRFDTIVRQAFSQPRKTLANNLKKLFTSEQLESLGINPAIRPQNIQIPELISLAQA